MASLVSKFSNQFKEIKKILSKVDGFNEVNLNKVEPKYTWWSTYSKSFQTKGVDSDFIRIYSLSNEVSIAFAFNNIEGEKPYVMTTMKKGEEIEGAKYSVESFKKELNVYLKVLRAVSESTEIDSSVAEKTFVSSFIKDNKYNPKSDVEAAVKKALKEIKSIKKKNAKKIAQAEASKIELKKIEDLINKKVEAAKEKYKVKDLQDQLNKALDKVQKLEEKLEKQHQLSEKKNKARKDDWANMNFRSEVRRVIEECSKEVPKGQRKQIEDLINQEFEKEEKEKERKEQKAHEDKIQKALGDY